MLQHPVCNYFTSSNSRVITSSSTTPLPPSLPPSPQHTPKTPARPLSSSCPPPAQSACTASTTTAPWSYSSCIRASARPSSSSSPSCGTRASSGPRSRTVCGRSGACPGRPRRPARNARGGVSRAGCTGTAEMGVWWSGGVVVEEGKGGGL